MSMKYSDYFMDSLSQLGYTCCFFVGGGNVMHLVEAARNRMKCVPVINEVSAGIAAEYFNIANRETNERAFALVTAGPGLTNIITAIGAAWMEGHELLVVGGQARTEFLSRGTVRQMGHQEIDGVQIVSSITNYCARIEAPVNFAGIQALTSQVSNGRKGPVFLELCLDVTATYESPLELQDLGISKFTNPAHADLISGAELNELVRLWEEAERPVLLIGTGLEYSVFSNNLASLEEIALPVATSWNAIDYVDYDSTVYAGRPDTYGMRWANAVIQQADLVIACGTRLGLQQTGFNWEEFVPVGKIVHIDIDPAELGKENPRRDLKIFADVNASLGPIIEALSSTEGKVSERKRWLSFISEIKNFIPAAETANKLFEGHVNPFEFVTELSEIAGRNWRVVPCSSGGSYTSMMQAFQQKRGQLLPNNKGLASMGYGLAGAIGTAVASPSSVTALVEGDGGFAQNLSELGTVIAQNLNLKIFVSDNGGYASIRISQKAYFDGNYIGCDPATGLGFPDWVSLFESYGIPVVKVFGPLHENNRAMELINSAGPAAIILSVHQDQPFLPKLTSRIYPDGSMKSYPIHLMHPPLDQDMADQVFKFLPVSMRYPSE